MRALCKDAKIPEPEFNLSSPFTVTFRKGSEIGSEKILILLTDNAQLSARELAVKLEISPRAVEKLITSLKVQHRLRRVGTTKGGHWEVIKGSEISSVMGSEKSSEKILTILTDNAQLSARELAVKLEISSRAVEKLITSLKKQGRLRRVGTTKGGHWEVMK